MDILTTRIYHLRGRARVQVYSGRGHGILTVDVQAIRQVVDAGGHEATEAYVDEEGGTGEWKMLTPGSEREVLEALMRSSPGGHRAARPPAGSPRDR